jgi:hypothetical protein
MASKTVTHGAPPPLHALLRAASRFLEADVLPRLDGATSLQLRMVIRQLAIGQRELLLGAELLQHEHVRLRSLVGCETDLNAGRALLARQIRERRVQADAAKLREHVVLSAREMLAIDNPAWDTPGRAPGTGTNRNHSGDKP